MFISISHNHSIIFQISLCKNGSPVIHKAILFVCASLIFLNKLKYISA
ncbi:MAG: hypothetical protein LBC61_06810 [Candidatus Peribacteria bacterium]|nr:hypothetical protein [Candidatus Peribacteria bacterium]